MMCVLSLLPTKLHGGTRFRARFITEEIQILGSSDHEGLGSLCRCRCTALLKLAVSNVDPSLSGIYLWQRRKHPLQASLSFFSAHVQQQRVATLSPDVSSVVTGVYGTV